MPVNKDRIGMLWFDNHPLTETVEKIRKGLIFYAKKYEVRPTWVQIHEGEASEAEAAEIERVLGLRVSRKPNILPNHFWMGVDL